MSRPSSWNDKRKHRHKAQGKSQRLFRRASFVIALINDKMQIYPIGANRWLFSQILTGSVEVKRLSATVQQKRVRHAPFFSVCVSCVTGSRDRLRKMPAAERQATQDTQTKKWRMPHPFCCKLRQSLHLNRTRQNPAKTTNRVAPIG